MYSRKFNQNSIPPDYSGVSFRQRANEAPLPPPVMTEDEDTGTREPRYPVQDRRQPSPRKFKFISAPDRKPPCVQKSPAKRQTTPTSDTPPRPKAAPSTTSLLSHSFTMEDIVLAGLILLLLNSECDNELLLVLGFLLLVGLQ